jgi:hypothetical protein
MGNMHPRTSVDVSSVQELTGAFTIKRTSGEWEEGHSVCPDADAWNAFDGPSCLAVPVASDTRHTHYDIATSEWHVFMSKGPSRGDKNSVSGWRKLSNIRPSNMTEEDAVAWRENLIPVLKNLKPTSANDMGVWVE